MAAILIFAITYFVLAIGRMPGFRVDRTGAAIIGASFMVGVNALSLQEAYRAINFDTIILLFGMMIVVVNLRLSGFFSLVAERVVERAHGPTALLASIVGVAGVFSAFFVNDTMCLVLTPLVLEIAETLGRDPVPYLLAVAIGSNMGSVATITGNPQNMMIGSFSGIPYRQFLATLAPVAALGLILTIVVIRLAYRREFGAAARVQVTEKPIAVDRRLMWKALLVAAGMIVMFFVGWPVPKVAIIAGAVLLITRRVDPDKVYQGIDWALLVMFSGLFIVIAGIEHTSLETGLDSLAARLHLDNVFLLSSFTAVLSNLVSNVPAVMVFKPLVGRLANPEQTWLTLAMASTLAGNLTVLGSVANLIVIEQARHKVRIGFWQYFRVGAPLAILTILGGAAWIQWLSSR
ncbi:MAG TPA: anion transporter [Bryobacteraceae bacterium]|nr:anion transporter [Bryobacteraceae bacterium]